MREFDPTGLWMTADGQIRQELKPDGRYDEARGKLEHVYQGRYWMLGDRIEYEDDAGFSAKGEFIGGALHHAGMVLRRVIEATARHSAGRT